MKLNFEKQTILTVVIFVGISIAVVGGVILPTMNYIKLLNKETEQLKTFIEKKYESSRQMRTAVRKIEEVRNSVSEYPQYIYQPGNELELITTLEAIAAKNKVQQKIVNSNLDQQNTKKIEIAVNVSGGLKNTLSYLSDIEATKYFLNVDKIQITTLGSKPGSSEPNNQTNLYLELSLYANQ